jgi:hypothetical protein
VKIDVEGYEAEVVEGARALLADGRRRPRLLCIEVHLALLARRGDGGAAGLRKRIEDAGYTVKPLGDRTGGEGEHWIARPAGA